MPTTKQRISITADTDLEHALNALAKRDRVSIASKAAELIRIGLDMEEDLYWAGIAEERLKDKKAAYIPHEEFWRKVRGNRNK